MTGKRIGYIRVSTIDQNPERQLEGIQLDKKFIDKISGKVIDRPELNALIDYVREDDTVIVHAMDRLARNVKDLRQIIDDLTARGIKVQFIKENLTFTGKDSPMSNLLLMLMGSIAEFEHSLIRERQMEGVALAKARGRYKGRPKKVDAFKIALLQQQLKGRKTKTQMAKDLGVSRFTIYRYLETVNEEKIEVI